jgi:hypothetical protein
MLFLSSMGGGFMVGYWWLALFRLLPAGAWPLSGRAYYAQVKLEFEH